MAAGEADRGLPHSPLAMAKMLYRGSLGELNPVHTSLSGATFSQAYGVARIFPAHSAGGRATGTDSDGKPSHR
jgi:hypothetical protein